MEVVLFVTQKVASKAKLFAKKLDSIRGNQKFCRWSTCEWQRTKESQETVIDYKPYRRILKCRLVPPLRRSTSRTSMLEVSQDQCTSYFTLTWTVNYNLIHHMHFQTPSTKCYYSPSSPLFDSWPLFKANWCPRSCNWNSSGNTYRKWSRDTQCFRCIAFRDERTGCCRYGISSYHVWTSPQSSPQRSHRRLVCISNFIIRGFITD